MSNIFINAACWVFPTLAEIEHGKEPLLYIKLNDPVAAQLKSFC